MRWRANSPSEGLFCRGDAKLRLSHLDVAMMTTAESRSIYLRLFLVQAWPLRTDVRTGERAEHEKQAGCDAGRLTHASTPYPPTNS